MQVGMWSYKVIVKKNYTAKLLFLAFNSYQFANLLQVILIKGSYTFPSCFILNPKMLTETMNGIWLN